MVPTKQKLQLHNSGEHYSYNIFKEDLCNLIRWYFQHMQPKILVETLVGKPISHPIPFPIGVLHPNNPFLGKQLKTTADKWS